MTIYELAKLSDAVYANTSKVEVKLRIPKSPPPNKPVTANLVLSGPNMPGLLNMRNAGSTPATFRQGIPKILSSGPPTEIVTWSRVSTWTNKAGFCAALFQRGSEQVLAYRGTDDLFDLLIDDASIAGGGTPLQTLPALLTAQMAQLNPDAYFTGHSLGGALAILAAAHTGRATVTFNAPGVMDSCIAASSVAISEGVTKFLAMVARCVSNARLKNIRIGGDLVSSWLTTGQQPGTTTTLSAKQCGLNAYCRHQMATILSAVECDDTYHKALNL